MAKYDCSKVELLLTLYLPAGCRGLAASRYKAKAMSLWLAAGRLDRWGLDGHHCNPTVVMGADVQSALAPGFPWCTSPLELTPRRHAWFVTTTPSTSMQWMWLCMTHAQHGVCMVETGVGTRPLGIRALLASLSPMSGPWFELKLKLGRRQSWQYFRTCNYWALIDTVERARFFKTGGA